MTLDAARMTPDKGRRLRLTVVLALAVCLLGCDWLNPPEELTVENLSNNDGWSSYPCVVCGPAGNTVVLWDEDSDGYEKIVMVEKQAGGEWSEQMTVSQDSSGSRLPDACFDSLGNLHLVYQRYSPGRWTIMYRCRDRDGTWAQEETVGGTWAVQPRFASGTGKRLVISYLEGASFEFLRCAMTDSSGGWTVETVPTVGEMLYGTIGELADGRLVATWTAISTDSLRYAVRSSLGTWSAPVLLDEAPCEWRWPALTAVGESAFVAYTRPKKGVGGDLTMRSFGNGWSEPDGMGQVEDGHYYSLCSDPSSGQLIVVLTRSRYSTMYLYHRSARWRLLATAAASGLTDLTSVAVGPLGDVHVVWPTHGPNEQHDIMYAELQLEPVAP